MESTLSKCRHEATEGFYLSGGVRFLGKTKHSGCLVETKLLQDGDQQSGDRESGVTERVTR